MSTDDRDWPIYARQAATPWRQWPTTFPGVFLVDGKNDAAEIAPWAKTFHADDPAELLERLQGLLAQMRKSQVFLVPDEAGVRAKYPTVESLNAAIEAKTKEI